MILKSTVAQDIYPHLRDFTCTSFYSIDGVIATDIQKCLIEGNVYVVFGLKNNQEELTFIGINEETYEANSNILLPYSLWNFKTKNIMRVKDIEGVKFVFADELKELNAEDIPGYRVPVVFEEIEEQSTDIILDY